MEVETPDGIVEFPDGTPPETVKAALRKKYASELGKGPLKVDIVGDHAPDRGGIMAGVDAAVRGLTSGIFSNFDDELVSGLNTILPIDKLTNPNIKSVWDGLSPLEAWKANMAEEAKTIKADQEQNGFLRGAGSVAGAIGGAIGGAKLAATALPRAASAVTALAKASPRAFGLGAGALGGGTSGAISGFGAGDTLDSREKSANIGAFTGAALGGAVGTGVAALAPAVKRYASVLLGKGNEQEAVTQIITSLRRDGFDVTSPSGVHALRAELSQFTGKPVSLADVGAATRARAGVGLRAPSGAQQQSIDQVMQRAQGQGPRLASDIRANVAPRTDVRELDEALVAQREATALPLREQALFEPTVVPPSGGAPIPIPQASATGAFNPPVPQNKWMGPATMGEYGPPAPLATIDKSARMVDDGLLNQLVTEHPFAQRALGGAVGLSQAERSLKQMLGQSLDDVPEMLAGQPLDYRTADYLKRFLDDQVNRLARRADTETFKAAEFGQVKALRDSIRERMRATNDEYGQYLDAYRGSSEMIDSLAEGRKYRDLDPEEITADQGERSTAAQELFRVGAARDLLDTLNSTKDRANPASRILNSPEERAQLAATGVPAENMARLNRSVEQERQLNLLPAELSGAQTAQRMAAAQDAEAGISARIPFNPGSVPGWFGAFLRAGANKASLKANAKVNESLLPRVLEKDPAAIARIITELESAGHTAQAAQLKRALRAGASARTLGTIIGSPVALPEGN